MAINIHAAIIQGVLEEGVIKIAKSNYILYKIMVGEGFRSPIGNFTDLQTMTGIWWIFLELTFYCKMWEY